MSKKIIITVGSPGSGKSTWAKEFCERYGYTYISQDDQGKDGHMKAFKNALLAGENIVVDRMNFNREQREIYVNSAQALDYEVTHKYFDESYKVCLERILSRQGHPTLKPDAKTARQVLDMYWENEDVFGIKGPQFRSNKKVLDLTFYSMAHSDRVFVISDLHGCYVDMCRLLETMGYRQGEDMLIIMGDLNDRGPDYASILKFVLNTPYVFVLRGNHDNKMIRWLKGNKVQTSSIEDSIKQLQDARMIDTQEQKDELYYKMMDWPYIIKLGNNYFAHAGFHPYKHPEATSREFCLFARHFDPAMGTFTREASQSMWFTFPRKHPEFSLFFGHIVQEKMPELPPGNENIYAMDGGICFGETCRGAIVYEDTAVPTIFEIPSTRPLRVKDDEWDFMNKFEPYDERVKKGLLRKVEKGDLVLYNYTDQCTYEKAWDKYTMECRGLILNKATGNTVARPFPKFFNLGELENKNLPQIPVGESYTIEDKLDGSLGIMYQDTDTVFKIATRGSFTSEQAIIATEILHDLLKPTPEGEEAERFLELTNQYTPLFEIIYPENRMNDGARLVCDYGNTRTLVLLAMIDKVSGKDASDAVLKEFADLLHCPLRQVFPYTLDEVVAMKSTLPVTREGFVVKFANGFRVKVKGDEYCRLQKVLNSISPLSIWDKMSTHPNFLLTDDYLTLIPEEILPEVKTIEGKLRKNWEQKILEFKLKFKELGFNTPRDLGLYCHDPKNGISKELSSALFMILNKKQLELFKYAAKCVRPTNNEL